MSADLQPRWDLSDYRDMLTSLVDSGRHFSRSSAPQLTDDSNSIWLRHDVELSLDAAIASACVEASLNITSTYFICADSPFLTGDPSTPDVVRQLIELGHNVGIHVVCAPNDTIDRVTGLRDRAVAQLGLHAESSVTLHCPGQRDPLALLAMCPTPSVYTSYASHGWDYVSDATGQWRYGSPIDRLAGLVRQPAQLLTHPYWWTRGSLTELDVCSDERRAFLPQYFAAASAASSGT
jgi:hypothetical protein